MKQDHEKNGTSDVFAKQVQTNQATLASALRKQYDFVVCGAGASGSVVAGRLASNPAVSVLLLEAGGTDDSAMVADPNRWLSTIGSELDWGFITEPNPNANRRAILYSMGKVLGGGASINVSTWSRGHKTDWDFYAAESGDPAWNYQSVLGLYHRIENWQGCPDPKYRGTGGPMNVQPAPSPHALFSAILTGAEENGIRRFDSANGEMAEQENGCAVVDEIVRKDGSRQSPFRSYAYPLMNKDNLTVLTGALVTRVQFSGNRATGIEFVHEGKVKRAEAQCEIVLSLGAIQTPKLMMQSGIGDETELKKFAVPLTQHLPGVGCNLHDHISFGIVWEAAAVPLPLAPRSQSVCFWKTDSGLEAPNAMAYGIPLPFMTPENGSKFTPPSACWSISAGMRGKSRGEVRLTGSGPSDPPEIQTNFLADPDDLITALRVIEMCREIGNSAALKPFQKREVAPGCLGKADLEAFVRDGVGTYWHQSGTAKMGRDNMSVVDSTLRVYGVEGLRIADASILPRVTTGNTMAPCVVIGERAADILQAEHKS